jgi:hypothetical protein
MAETATEQAARKAERLRSTGAPTGPPAEDRPSEDLGPVPVEARPSRTVRTRKVRRTVDLPPGRHHKLTEWCQDEAMTLGVARVSGQEVISELVHLLLTDETTARKVHAALAEAAAATEADRRVAEGR